MLKTLSLPSIARVINEQLRKSHVLYSALFACLLVSQSVSGQSYVQSTTTYSWDDLVSGGGTNISTTTCDECNTNLTIPFTFNFYGTGYTSVNVSTNGIMKFGSTGNNPGNACIANAAAPNNYVAAYWDDLTFDYGCSPTFWRYQTIGSAPNRRFVVSWIGFLTYNDYINWGCGYYVYTQIKLYETSNIIEVHHQTSNTVVPSNSGTIGIENNAGTAGNQASCNVTVANNTAWRWTPCLSAPQAVGNITVGPAAGISGALSDANISANGCYNSGAVNSNCSAGGVGSHEAYRGRLFRSTSIEGGTIAWAADQNVAGKYWQVDLGSVMPVNGIASQGREDCCSQWVTNYTVQTSIDGTTWYAVPGTFTGNSDAGTVVTNWIGQYHARYVRIYAGTFNGHISARFDVLSIPEGSSASAQTVYASGEVVSGANSLRWYDAASGGTLLGTGRTISQSITANTTIYAASYNTGTGAESCTRTAVTLRINDMYGAGPAGVGNTNGRSDLTCWMDASKISQTVGTAVATWTDQSGWARSATQGTAANQPTLQTAAGLNNQPVVRFSTSVAADQMSTANFQSQYGGYSVFSASKLNGGANQRLITSSVRNWLLGYWNGLTNVTFNEGWNSAAGCGTGGIGANTNTYIHQVNSTGPNTLFYSNGNTVLGGGATCGIQSFGGFALGGGCCPGLSEMSDGDIGEVISYDRAINEARRLIVQNYLAAKYNTAITNDLYAGDGVGDCDFEVSGVGRDMSGIHASGWSGGLYVTTTIADYLKDNGDYMLFGRNNSTGGWETSNLVTCGTPNPSRRLSRIWYVDKTDGGTAGGNVTLAFDLNELQGAAPLAATNYRLMYRVANTGNFASIATGSVVGNRVQFTVNATAIVDGQYTLAYEADIPRAMALNGSNQYIEVPNATSLQTPGDFTYELWVRPVGFSAYNTYIENGLWGGQTMILRQESPTQIYLYMNGIHIGIVNYGPTVNVWTHLALVRSGATITLYANGVSVGNFTTSYAAASLPTAVMRIGSSVHTTGQMFNGLIDEFRLWNRALTPAEIVSRMHSNISNTDAYWTNLQAYYKFDESGGTKVFDLSQNNNNGTPVSSPTVTALHSAGITDVSGTTPICINTAANYSIVNSNANSRLTYNWVASAGTINSGQGTPTVNVTWTSSGAQTLTVTVTHSTNCHTESFVKNITVDATPVSPTLSAQSPVAGNTICAGYNSGTATFTGGSGGGSNEYQFSINGGSTWNTYTNGAAITTTGGTGSVQVRGRRSGGGCTASAYNTYTLWNFASAPVAPALSAASPVSGSTVCVGFNTGTVTGAAGSGGSSGAADEYQVSLNGGSTWTTYTSGSAINTSTATGNIIVQSRRTGGSYGCTTTGWSTISTWNLATTPTAPTLSAASPTSGSTVCAGFNTGTVTGTGGSGGSTGAVNEYQVSLNGGSTWTSYTNGGAINTSTATGSIIVQSRRTGGTYGCSASAWSTISTWNLGTTPTAPTLSAASPVSGSTVCASFNTGTVTGAAGSGGSTGAVDEYQVSLNGGSTWSSYTNGAAINTSTATGSIIVQSRRTGGTYGCSTSAWSTISTWTLGTTPVAPTLSAASPVSGTTICAGFNTGTVTGTGGSGGSTGAVNEYQVSLNGGSTWTTYTNGSAINTSTATGSIIVQSRRTGGTYGCSATSWSTISTWSLGTTPTAPTLNSASPTNGSSICIGFNTGTVTGNTGTGGSTGAVDEYQVSINGGSTWSSYTNGAAINTTGGSGSVIVQSRRTGGSYGCSTSGWSTIASWTINPVPAAFTVNQITTTPLCFRGTSEIQVPSSIIGLSYQLRDNTTNVGSAHAGTGGTLTFNTNNLTATNANYNVLATTGASCTTSVAAGSITVDVLPNAYANNGDSRTCYVNSNNYVEFRSVNGIMVAINSNGQNLGNVTVTEYSGAPVNVQACDTYQPWYVTAALGRHWAIEPQFQPASPVSIRLYFDNSDYTALQTAANANANPNDNIVALGSMDLSKYSNPGNPSLVNGIFTDNCNSGSSTVHAQTVSGSMTSLSDLSSFMGTGRYAQYSFTGFSEFWMSGTNNVSPLPIVLTSFTATCDAGNVKLDWTTATEINNEKFIVERSANLQTWEEVTTMPGAGNSNESLNYSSLDERPIDGLSYYRLTQRDYDGASETFDPISITCYSDGKGNKMMVYPNPATDKFTVSINMVESFANGQIEILDITGKRIVLRNVNLSKGDNEFTFDREQMNPGQYVIVLSSGAFHAKPVKLIIK